MNEVLEKLPRHLLNLVVDQPYNEYTAQDHALWQYVMRQNVRYLSRVAHGSYTDGLKQTGISIDRIPHMYGMNRILEYARKTNNKELSKKAESCLEEIISNFPDYAHLIENVREI